MKRGSRRSIFAVALAASLALTGACSSRYGATDGVFNAGSLQEDPAAQRDAQSDTGAVELTMPDADAASAPDAEGGSDAGSACPLTNLVSNANFENGGVGWLPWNGDIAVTPGARRTGAAGMQVCRRAAVSEYDADQKFATMLPAATYYARAWFRADADAGAGAGVGELYMTDENAYAATYKQVGQVGPVWTCGEVQGTQVVASFGVGGKSTPLGTCVNADDVALYLVPASGIPPECKCP
jgi:hypothetical protein